MNITPANINPTLANIFNSVSFSILDSRTFKIWLIFNNPNSSRIVLFDSLSRNQLPWTQPRPFAAIFRETLTANHIPFHLDTIVVSADVNINAGAGSLKVGQGCQMRLMMLSFDCMISRTSIDIFAIDTDTHKILGVRD
jgi:hypothetical protein